MRIVHEPPTVAAYPDDIDRIIEALISTPGVTEPSMRVAAIERAARASGAGRDLPPVALPDELADYVEMVATSAHEIDDGTIERLKEAGSSEEEVFELTIAAAIGAGLARYERGRELIEQAREVSTAEAGGRGGQADARRGDAMEAGVSAGEASGASGRDECDGAAAGKPAGREPVPAAVDEEARA